MHGYYGLSYTDSRTRKENIVTSPYKGDVTIIEDGIPYK